MAQNYKLVCDESWTEVESLVNESIKNGYIPLGSPFVFIQKDDKGDDQQLICQSVMLYGLFPSQQ